MPALVEYLAEPQSERRANILATAINDHAEWTFRYYPAGSDRVFGANTPHQFREALFSRCPELRMMWDLADASKHRFLTKPGIPRTVAVSTAAYTVKSDELYIQGFDQPFSAAAQRAVGYWKQWSD